MAEVNFVVKNREIIYEGLMDLPGLVKIIDLWFKEQGYTKRETKNFEQVYEDGKELVIEMFPYKKISDNVKFELRLHMIFTKVVDADIEKDGKKLRMQKGRVRVVIDAFMVTDYEHKWDKTPLYYFLRVIYDKYFHKNYITLAKEEYLNDVAKIEDEIKSYLNLFRYR